MVIAGFRAELPFVNLAAAPFGLYPVLRSKMLRQQLMYAWLSSEQGQTPPVAHGYCQAGMNETFPVVGVEQRMPDSALATDIRNHPVKTEPVADLTAIFTHRLG